MTASRVSWNRLLATAITAATLGLTAAGFAPIAGAQQNPSQNAPAAAPSGKRVTHREQRTFDHYLNRHPKIARQLRKDPSLVNNPDFLAKHTSLQKFLTAHPTLQARLQENPGAFTKREKRHEHKHRGSKA